MRTLMLIAALCLGSAHADDSYFTLGIAHGSFDATPPPGCALAASSTSGTGAALGVGYGFGAHLAVEFGYQNAGALDVAGTCGIAATPVTVIAPDRGLALAAVARWPLASAWTLYGRLGGFSWSKSSVSGTESLIGFGGEYQLSRGIGLRLEYQRIGSDLDAISLGLRLGF